MKTSFLIATATAVLLAGTSVVSAQNTNTEPRQDLKAAPNTQMKSQNKVQNNAPNNSGQAAQDKSGQDKSGQDKAKDAAKSARQPTQAPSTTGQGASSPDNKRQPNAGAQAPVGQQPKASQSPGTNSSAQGQNQGQIQSGSPVALTVEQKATIRQSVLGSNSAPKVSSVNFSLNVGTSVPNTVRLVAVPEPLFRIHPAWRGYVYFIVGDEIIIVDRGTHRIVAVLTV